MSFVFLMFFEEKEKLIGFGLKNKKTKIVYPEDGEQIFGAFSGD